MSAANAIDEISDAAPAARRDLTLRIGFVLMAGEAKYERLTFWKLTGGRCQQMFKRHLTLIFKVDFFSPHTRMQLKRCKNAAGGPPQLLTIDEAATRQSRIC
jgi:hypothetical protein